MKASITAAAAVIALVGCATVGREISPEQLATLQKGKTTPGQAIAALGQPTASTRLGDGRRVLTYSFAHVQARPESFIPIVGLFAGGTDVRSSAVTLTFSADGVLQEYASSQTFTGAGTGFASGTYTTPDRTLPQEALR